MKNACGKRPQTCQPLTIKIGYLFGTLRWRNNALSIKKYAMAAPIAVLDFKRRCPFPCLSIPGNSPSCNNFVFALRPIESVMYKMHVMLRVVR